MTDSQIRVAYDLSVVGLGVQTNRAKTGVYRAVERVARHLVTRDDIDIAWTAFAHHDHLTGLRQGSPFPGFERFPVIACETRHRWVSRLSHLNDSVGAIGYGLGRVTAPPRWMLNRFKSRSQLSPSQLKSFDIFHSPFHQWPKWSESLDGVARVLSIYDLIPLKFPDWFEFGEPEKFRRKLDAIQRSDWVICCSESTRNDLLEARPTLRPEQVRVTPLAAPDTFVPCNDQRLVDRLKQRLGMPADASYFLSLCTLEPRKNLRHLIAAFDRVCEDSHRDPYLVLAGAAGWKFDDILKDASTKRADRILVTGFMDEEELPPLYSGATAFVYPSLYEGFGLPPLEAMSCATPVITSDNSSLPEVVGDAGILIPATDLDALVDAMKRLLEDDEHRARLSESGLARAATFHWDRCGEETVAIYRDAMSHRT